MEKETKRELPEAFVEKMKKLLGSDAESFFKSYDAERKFGLRVNPLKQKSGEMPEEGEPLGDYLKGLARVPWAEEGFYYEADMRPGRHPFHEAGAYYIQEPSAMSTAEALAPKPGERILDLCAAPGGKSTHLAGKMGGQGLLVCNEIHSVRAKILSQNIERLGVENAGVTNMDPFQLVPAFKEFFDGIVVDAPCSGEGMFRKDENARNEWSPDHVKQCAGSCSCHAVLTSAGFGDNPLFAHFLCQQNLSQHVVDLVCAGVVQIFPLQIDLAAAQIFCHPVCVVQHRRSAGIVPEQCPVFFQKFRIIAVFGISCLQLMHCVHNGFRHILSAENPKSTYFTHDIHLV